MTCRIRTLILAVLAIAVLVAGIYAINRPMAYGTSYYHASVYEGSDFSGSFTFYPDNTMVIQNTNFAEATNSFYYYKDGYIFFTLAATEEEYEELVDYAIEIGLEQGFIQEGDVAEESFIPAFDCEGV